MTTKQKMIKAIYPAFIKITSWFNKSTGAFKNEKNRCQLKWKQKK